MPRVIGVSVARATGRKRFADPASPAVCCAAARAQRPIFHPPGAVGLAAGVRAGLFRTSPRKTPHLVDGVTVSREALHARLHPSRAVEHRDCPPCGMDDCIIRQVRTWGTHRSGIGRIDPCSALNWFGSTAKSCMQNRLVLGRLAAARPPPSCARRGAHATSPGRVAIERGKHRACGQVRIDSLT